MAFVNVQAALPIVQEIIADGAGQFAASMALGPILPDSNNIVVNAVASGAIAEAGSSAAKMFLYGAPMPTVTGFADGALYNGAFLAASSQFGLIDRAYEVTGSIGLGGNADVQGALVNGLASVSGQFVRDQIRAMYGPSIVTDPLASLYGAKASSESGLSLTL